MGDVGGVVSGAKASLQLMESILPFRTAVGGEAAGAGTLQLALIDGMDDGEPLTLRRSFCRFVLCTCVRTARRHDSDAPMRTVGDSVLCAAPLIGVVPLPKLLLGRVEFMSEVLPLLATDSLVAD